MRKLPFVPCCLALLGIAPASYALTPVTNFGPNPAGLTMQEYVPQGMPAAPRPLVVALHGCTQSPDVYVDAGWNALADEWKFYVVYPGQNTTKNNSEGCFNWGGRWPDAPNDFVVSAEALDLTTIARGHDENESIKEMVDTMKATHAIDASRVFVTGLSAGGGMTALLLAAWPDVFAGGAIFAGIPYGCATIQATTAEAQACTTGGYTGSDAYLSRTPQAWGDLVRKAYAGYTGPYPRVSLWQGTSDSVVSPANQAELVKQWTDVHGASQSPSSTNTVDGFPHAVYNDAHGVAVVETYTITGQGHGTEIATSQPVDPASPNGEKCGQAGAYFLDVGICSTYYAAKFFGLDQPGSSPDGGTAGGGADAGTEAGADDAGTGSGAGGDSGGEGAGGTMQDATAPSGSAGGGGSPGPAATSDAGSAGSGSPIAGCAVSGASRASRAGERSALVGLGLVLLLAAARRRTAMTRSRS